MTPSYWLLWKHNDPEPRLHFCLVVATGGENRLSSRRPATVGDLAAMAHLVQGDEEECVAGGAHHLLQTGRRGLGRSIEAGLAELLENLHVPSPQVAISSKHLAEGRVSVGVRPGFGSGREERRPALDGVWFAEEDVRDVSLDER